MNEDVEIDAFVSMFKKAPDDAERAAKRQARAKKERRAQLTPKQRKRGGGAVRTTQLNFRCSPAFRELVAVLSAKLDCSIADVLEEALQLFAEAKGMGE